jgi:hypothetical protein
VTPQALAAMAPPTPVWVQPLWDLTDPCLLRWAASAQMAALGLDARRWALEPFSTTRVTTGMGSGK